MTAPVDDDLLRGTGVIAGSVVVGAASAIIDRIVLAARHSSLLRLLAALAAEVRTSPLDFRIRFVAGTIAISAVAHETLRAMLPGRLAPAAPHSAAAIVALFAIAAAVLATPLARAIQTRRAISAMPRAQSASGSRPSALP